MAAIAEYSAEEMDRLASIRERLAKATPGPWRANAFSNPAAVGFPATDDVWVERPDDDGRDELVIAEMRSVDCDPDRDEYAEKWDNADFIAHAPDDMAWLLARFAPPTESSAIAAPEGPASADRREDASGA